MARMASQTNRETTYHLGVISSLSHIIYFFLIFLSFQSLIHSLTLLLLDFLFFLVFYFNNDIYS
jgi:hypothetical protein